MSLRALTRNAARALRVLNPFQDGRSVRVLCYHRVRPQQDYLSVTPEDFEAQMKHLAGLDYQSVSIGQMLSGETGPRSIVLTFDDGFADNFECAYPIMKNYGFTASIFCIAGKMDTPGYLSRAQVLAMMKDGFEFGAHTLSHPHLPKISLEARKDEILQSKSELEQWTGKTFDYFCYPYGEYDAECLQILKGSAYKGACSNIPGSNRPGRVRNPFLVKRTEISGFDTLEDFDLKLAGAYDVLHQILHVVRGRP